MRLQVLAGTVAIAGLAWFPVAAVQLPGLNAGMVTAKINGEPGTVKLRVNTLNVCPLCRVPGQVQSQYLGGRSTGFSST